MRLPRARTGRFAAATVGLLALAAVPAGCGGDPPRPAGPPARRVQYAADGTPEDGARATRRLDLVLVCLDTVRADAFAPWARGTPAMPRSSAWLAARGVTFTQAATAAPWTGPAVASLLTGMLPSEHGARELRDDLKVVPAVTSLAEVLSAQGWFTVAYTGGGWVRRENGMLQGFREPMEPFSFAGEGSAILRVFEASRGYRPRFLFFHTYEAHDPYLAPPARLFAPKPPPPAVDLAAIDREAAADGGRSLVRRFLLDGPTREVVFGSAFGGPRKAAVTRWLEHGYRTDPEGPALAAEAKAAYEAGLRRLDDALVAWLDGIAALGALDDAVLVVTSDHGEGFGEHGTMHHGRRLYDELLRVPLFVSGPGFPAGRVVDAPCSLLDVVPTALELVGLPPAAGLAGTSLLGLVAGGAGAPALAEERRTGAETGGDDDALLTAVRDARHKWVRTLDLKSGTASEELYDLAADPGETTPRPDAALGTTSAAFQDAVRRSRPGR